MIVYILLYSKGMLCRACSHKLYNFAPNVMYIFLSHLQIIWYVNLFWKYSGLGSICGDWSGIIQLILIVFIQVLVLKLIAIYKAQALRKNKGISKL